MRRGQLYRVPAQRLFRLGIDIGKKVLREARANRGVEEKVWDQLPRRETLGLAGDSVEFMLGRIFENAMVTAMDDVRYDYADRSKVVPPARWKLHASLLYAERNCELIGR